MLLTESRPNLETNESQTPIGRSHEKKLSEKLHMD